MSDIEGLPILAQGQPVRPFLYRNAGNDCLLVQIHHRDLILLFAGGVGGAPVRGDHNPPGQRTHWDVGDLAFSLQVHQAECSRPAVGGDRAPPGRIHSDRAGILAYADLHNDLEGGCIDQGQAVGIRVSHQQHTPVSGDGDR